MSTPNFQERLERCAFLMQAQRLDALILTKPANMFYLTGDGRLCAYAFITANGIVTMGVPKTDVGEVRQATHVHDVIGFEDEIGMIHSIAHCFERSGIRQGTVGLEYAFLPQPRMGMLIHPHAKPEDVVAADCTPLMSELRLVKDDFEIACLQAAARVADIGMEAAVSAVAAGVTESQVAGAAEYAMRQAGATDFYRTYVATGARTNIAHGVPTLRILQNGDLVMIDLHPVANGYASDLCRTVCVGKPTSQQQAAYDLYLRAQRATVAKAKAGVEMTELEQTMHQILKDAGHGEHIFGPPIHGIGIEFEESPLPAGHAFFHGEKAPPPLPAKVVIAIGNCGLYLGPWGVRVEDTVVVGHDGPQVLTNYPTGLEIS